MKNQRGKLQRTIWKNYRKRLKKSTSTLADIEQEHVEAIGKEQEQEELKELRGKLEKNSKKLQERVSLEKLFKIVESNATSN